MRSNLSVMLLLVLDLAAILLRRQGVVSEGAADLVVAVLIVAALAVNLFSRRRRVARTGGPTRP